MVDPTPTDDAPAIQSVRPQAARPSASAISSTESSSTAATPESKGETPTEAVQPMAVTERRQEAASAARQENYFSQPENVQQRSFTQAYGGDDTPFDFHADASPGEASRVSPTIASTVKPASSQPSQASSQQQSQDTGGFSSGDGGTGDGDQRGSEHAMTGGVGRGGPQAQTSSNSALNAIIAAMEPETGETEEAEAHTAREISGGAATDSVKLEQVASRNAASTMSTLLKKANKEKETGDISTLDETEAMETLDTMLKLGGQDTERSQRVAKHALAMADQLGISDSRTRKQLEDGAMLIDIGQAGINLASANDEQMQVINSFLEEEGGLKTKALHAATVLRDIGMVGVDESIQGKTMDEMTAGELEEYKQHPAIGGEIIGQIGSLKHLAPIIRGHHENWDGSGFPDGLKERDIPLASRIIAVADHFEDLMTPGEGKEPFTMEGALQTLRDGAGTKFDPNLINAFMMVMEKATPEAE